MELNYFLYKLYCLESEYKKLNIELLNLKLPESKSLNNDQLNLLKLKNKELVRVKNDVMKLVNILIIIFN